MEPLAEIEIPPAVTAVPKADIHLHAETGARMEQVVAERTGGQATDWRELARELMRTRSPGMARLETWGPDMPVPRAWVDELDRDSENCKARVRRILVEAAADGAVLVEVLYGASTILRQDSLELFAEALAEVRGTYPQLHAVPLIVAFTTREWAETMLPHCLAAARRGVAGVNILPVPYDEPADWSLVYGWAERVRDAGLGITAHAGEFGALHLAEALEVPGITRIGHAVAAGSDPRLLDRIAERGVTLECPLSSNVVLGAVDRYENHPLRRFVERGIPVTICTDDPLRACTTIGREYAIAVQLGFSTGELREFTRAALRASFCDAAERDRLLRLVE